MVDASVVEVAFDGIEAFVEGGELLGDGAVDGFGIEEVDSEEEEAGGGAEGSAGAIGEAGQAEGAAGGGSGAEGAGHGRGLRLVVVGGRGVEQCPAGAGGEVEEVGEGADLLAEGQFAAQARDVALVEDGDGGLVLLGEALEAVLTEEEGEGQGELERGEQEAEHGGGRIA